MNHIFILSVLSSLFQEEPFLFHRVVVFQQLAELSRVRRCSTFSVQPGKLCAVHNSSSKSNPAGMRWHDFSSWTDWMFTLYYISTHEIWCLFFLLYVNRRATLPLIFLIWAKQRTTYCRSSTGCKALTLYLVRLQKLQSTILSYENSKEQHQ